MMPPFTTGRPDAKRRWHTLQLAYLQAAQARLTLVYDLLVTELQLRRLTGGLVG